VTWSRSCGVANRDVVHRNRGQRTSCKPAWHRGTRQSASSRVSWVTRGNDSGDGGDTSQGRRVGCRSPGPAPRDRRGTPRHEKHQEDSTETAILVANFSPRSGGPGAVSPVRRQVCRSTLRSDQGEDPAGASARTWPGALETESTDLGIHLLPGPPRRSLRRVGILEVLQRGISSPLS
jgi:hypothetical protein